MKKKRLKDRMPELKRLAKACNCTIEDDRCDCKIWANANDGWSWESGERSCCIEAYGSDGCYEPEWRQQAIADMIERLNDEPTEPIAYLYS